MHDHHEHHEHEHEHAYAHEHEHEHKNEHSRAGAANATAKDVALLKYMLEHNKQHAKELEMTGERLSGAGRADAAALINEAVCCFSRANEKLEEAVSIVES